MRYILLVLLTGCNGALQIGDAVAFQGVTTRTVTVDCTLLEDMDAVAFDIAPTSQVRVTRCVADDPGSCATGVQLAMTREDEATVLCSGADMIWTVVVWEPVAVELGEP